MARVLFKGNEVIAEAALRAGVEAFFGYPITPQNEIPEYFSRRMPEVGGVFDQGESEVASVYFYRPRVSWLASTWYWAHLPPVPES